MMLLELLLTTSLELKKSIRLFFLEPVPGAASQRIDLPDRAYEQVSSGQPTNQIWKEVVRGYPGPLSSELKFFFTVFNCSATILLLESLRTGIRSRGTEFRYNP